jgi:hypothetical protein
MCSPETRHYYSFSGIAHILFPLKSAELIHKFNMVIKHHILQSANRKGFHVSNFCLQANEKKNPFIFQCISTN